VIYGLICVTLVGLRYQTPEGYQPDFRCPGSPWLSGLDALASFGLIAFMNPLSIGLRVAILAGTGVWH